MHESFGARLRRRREEQGIDLIAIADQTKIKRSLLEALERDDVSAWPAGIFRRAYIRAYGHAIGLDPDLVVREFLEAHPDPAAVVTTEALASAVDARGGAPTRLRTMVGSALESLAWLRRPPVADEPAVPATLGAAMRMTTTHGELAQQVPDPAGPVIAEPASASIASGVEEEPTVAAEPPPIDATASAPPAPEPAAPPAGPDFLVVAQLCVALGRADHADDVAPLLADVTRALDAAGLIVWIWDAAAASLGPAMSHGYSARVLAQIPSLPRDADNATAAAFRTGESCVIDGGAHASGAVVVPLLTADGPAGALAVELQQGREHLPSVLAAATMFAAVLAQKIPARVERVAPTPAPASLSFTRRAAIL